MAYGIVLIDWDREKGPIVAGHYFEKQIEFQRHYATRTFLTHASHGWDKEKVQEELFLQFNEMTLVSHYFTLQIDNLIRRVIIAIVLRNDEKPDKYFNIIKEISQEILNNIDLSEEKLGDLLREIYNSKIKNISAKFTESDIVNMIPLLKEEFKDLIYKDNKIKEEITKKFGEIGIEILKNLPQDLKIENLAENFHTNFNKIAEILIWAAENGYIRLLKL